MYDDKHRNYSIEYAKKNLKRIPLDVRKEYYNDVILPEAKKRGMSVRAFILMAIENEIGGNDDEKI